MKDLTQGQAPIKTLSAKEHASLLRLVEPHLTTRYGVAYKQGLVYRLKTSEGRLAASVKHQARMNAKTQAGAGYRHAIAGIKPSPPAKRSEPSTEHVNLRVDPASLARFKRCADVLGVSFSAFMLKAGDELADKVEASRNITER